jgi:metal-sulfur cluster biosynthetic enzyme
MQGKPGTNRPIWSASSTHPELAAALETTLKDIVDPEINFNIIQLGLVRDVTISEEQVVIRMILTTPFCPYGPAMLEATRQKAEMVLERPAKIDFGMDAWDFSMMEEGLMDDWGLY